MQANPFDAMAQSYNALQGAQDQRTQNRAGRAYAAGDMGGVSNALASGGQVENAQSFDHNRAVEGRQQEADTRAQAEQRFSMLDRGVRTLQGVPAEQRNQVFKQMAPQLSAILGPDVIQQLGAADMSDESLAAFSTALGGEAQKLRLFQEARGGDIIGVDERTGQERSRIAGSGPADPTAPNGYRWTQDGNLEAIPGGPSDPRVVGTRAAAGRAPRRPSGNGGGHPRQSSAAAPAARPWERY